MEMEYVSPTTRKLADILGVEPVTTMEEVAEIFETTEAKAEEAGLGLDEAWAAKVRKELPMGVRLRRLEPRICELDPYQTGAALELFGSIEKIRLLKLRGDRCGDWNAKDIVELQLEGNPAAARDIERKGLIAWWKDRRGAEETAENLTRIGFSEEEARRLAGVQVTGEKTEQGTTRETKQETSRETKEKTPKDRIRERMKL